MQLNHGTMARVPMRNFKAPEQRPFAVHLVWGPIRMAGAGGQKKTSVFWLENLVKFGKFQQNLEKMAQKTWDVPT